MSECRENHNKNKSRKTFQKSTFPDDIELGPGPCPTLVRHLSDKPSDTVRQRLEPRAVTTSRASLLEREEGVCGSCSGVRGDSQHNRTEKTAKKRFRNLRFLVTLGAVRQLSDNSNPAQKSPIHEKLSTGKLKIFVFS